MFQSIYPLFPAPGTWQDYLLRGALTFLLVAILARFLAWLILAIETTRLSIRQRGLSQRRRETLRHLIRSLMNALAVLLAIVLTLGMFVQPGALLTALGLLSAGISFAARPFISDFLGGIVLVLEDQFVMGDKVEIGDRNVIGVVERVSLRTTHLRGDAGELWIVPNGDVRTIRNFTRGSFSPASIRITIPTARLGEALALLENLIADPGPDVIAPPEIISEDGQLGDTTTLLFKVQARHGAAPAVRLRLMAQIQTALADQRIIMSSA